MAMSKQEFDALMQSVKDMNASQKKRFVKELGIDTSSKRESRPSRTSRTVGDTTDAIKNFFPNIEDSAKQAVGSIVGNIGDIEGAFSSLTQEVIQNRNQAEAFFQAGFDKRYFDMSKAIGVASDTSFKLTGNLKASKEAVDGLRDGFQGYALASDELKNSVSKMSTSLTAAGVDAREYASVIESSTYAFGQSRGQLEDMTAALMATSREFAIAPRKMIRDYNQFQKNFAYSADKTMDVFVKLQKMSRTTGVSFETLASSFGDSMDQFDSSAQMAGRLNQILGKSMFNSIDLLNKTEEERAATIREGIIERFGTNVNNMGKFELKALAKTLGMNVDEARRFLSGKPKELDEALGKIKDKSPAEIQAQKLGDELKQLSDGMRAYRRPIENALIDLNNSFREGVKSSQEFREGLDSFANSTGLKALKAIGLVEMEGERAEYSQEFTKISNTLKSVGKTFSEEMTGENSTFATKVGEFANSASTMAKSLINAVAPGGGMTQSESIDFLNNGGVVPSQPSRRTPATPRPPAQTKTTQIKADNATFVARNFTIVDSSGKTIATGEGERRVDSAV